jgi:Fe-S-cluster containining protein
MEFGVVEKRAIEREVRAVLRAADAAFARYSCPASGECCQLARTGKEPWLWPGEWRLLVGAVKGKLPPARADGGCPFLDSSGKRCSVYAERPFGCRTFFCERIRGPARQPAEQVDALLRRLEAAHLEEPDAAPRPLREWHARASEPCGS